jgi:flagellar motility protein MotE (MotC chaperone)
MFRKNNETFRMIAEKSMILCEKGAEGAFDDAKATAYAEGFELEFESVVMSQDGREWLYAEGVKQTIEKIINRRETEREIARLEKRMKKLEKKLEKEKKKLDKIKSKNTNDNNNNNNNNSNFNNDDDNKPAAKSRSF